MDKFITLHLNSSREERPMNEEDVLDFTHEEKEEILSTLRVLKKTSAFEEREQEFTTMCFNAGLDETRIQEAKKVFLYTEDAEAWEKNILALEKGEWAESMETKCFHRWNHQRPSFLNMLVHIFHPSESKLHISMPTEAQHLPTKDGGKTEREITGGNGKASEETKAKWMKEAQRRTLQLSLTEDGKKEDEKKGENKPQQQHETKQQWEEKQRESQQRIKQENKGENNNKEQKGELMASAQLLRERGTTLDGILDKNMEKLKQQSKGLSRSDGVDKIEKYEDERGCLSDSEKQNKERKKKKWMLRLSSHEKSGKKEKSNGVVKVEVSIKRSLSASLSDDGKLNWEGGGGDEAGGEKSQEKGNTRKSKDKKEKSKKEVKTTKEKRSDLIGWLLTPTKGPAGGKNGKRAKCHGRTEEGS